MILSALILVWIGTSLMLAMMGALWAVHVRTRNAAWVDVGWAAGLGLLAALYAALGPAPAPRKILLALIVCGWSLRLTAHLYRDRVAGGQPEEGRYQTIRASWGGRIEIKFLFFFLFQGVLDVVLALPFLLIAFNTGAGFSPWEWAGGALWLLALAGETLADRQLKAFKADPANRGRVCRAGLWGLSRHPNYFCEWLVWCAYALAATAAPWGWLGWISPAVILFLLLKVSGIPPTEAQALKSRGDAYRRYQAEVPAFFPRLFKKGSRA